MTRLIDGEVLADVQPEMEGLRAEIRSLKRAVTDAQTEAARSREDADRALSMLRRQLGPLYRALQAVFGELDAAGVRDDAASTAPTGATSASALGMDARVVAVYQSWKERLGPSCAKIIDALILHSDLNTQQLAIAAGMSRQNVSNLMVKLNRAGLIAKNGGRFSLKQL